MSWYRKVDVRLWGDAKFCSLSRPQPNAQTIWLYLLTGPHTTSLPGLFHIGEAAIFEALGWDDESLPEGLREGYREAFREAFRELSDKGMLKVDRKARVIWIPNCIKYNPPESPNVIRSWPKQFDMIPECELKSVALQHIKDFTEGYREAFGEAFREAFPKVFPKTLANQQQQQQQHQQQTHTHTPQNENENQNDTTASTTTEPIDPGRQVSNDERREKARRADEEAEREYPVLRCLEAWDLTTPPACPVRRKTTRAEWAAMFIRLVEAGVTVEAIVADLRNRSRDPYEFPSAVSRRLTPVPKAREPTGRGKIKAQDDSEQTVIELTERFIGGST